MRAAILQLFHEANAFKPELVGLDDFEKRHLLCGSQVRSRFADTRNWMGGVLEALDQAGIDIEIGLCTAAHPGGMVDSGTYHILEKELLDSLAEICVHGTPDIICLLLHGALAVRGIPDPESRLVQKVRALVGPGPVVACALDFHGNPGAGLMDAADIVVPGIQYPHDDTRERGIHMVRLAIVCRAQRLHSWRFRLPLAVSMPRQTTVEGPFGTLVAWCRKTAENGVCPDIALMGGFPYAVDDRSCTSLIVTGSDYVQARSIFTELAELVWSCRDSLLKPIAKIATAGDIRRLLTKPGTLVMADVGDNPGAGGFGDDANLLKHLFCVDIPFAFGILVSPKIVDLSRKAGIGARFRTEFGTRHPRFPEQATWQAPVEVLKLGTLIYRNAGPMMAGEVLNGGLCAVLRLGRGEVLVSSARIQAYDVQAFLSQGIDLHSQRIIAIKASAHFRSSYAAYATAGIELVNGGGWSDTEMQTFNHNGRKRPILPLHPISRMHWQTAIELERLNSNGSRTC